MKIILLISVTICSLHFVYSQEQTSDTLKTKPLIIKSTTTTDRNYEINKQKSTETQKKMNSEPVQIVKNDEYYKSNIQFLKIQIKKIEETPNKEGVNLDKLENLKEELITFEKEYSNYLKNK